VKGGDDLRLYNNARILLLLALAIAAAVTGGGFFDGHLSDF
jgi:hypothetical protein